MKPILIETQHGLGDCVFHRAFVKTMCTTHEVYLKTPFMEVYEDLPVKFVQPSSTLRTQDKAIARNARQKFHVLPPHAPTITPRYNGTHLQHSNIVDGLAQTYACKPSLFDLPKFKSPITTKKPICVVRPATIRKEWLASGRNPNPQYIHDVVEWLRKTHYIVSVADLEDGAEYALDPLPYADVTVHKGELTIRELLGLVRKADIVVGGVGWIVPACIAMNTRLFCILGGTGMYNAPEKITHSSMDLSKIYFARPDNYCMCTGMQHDCNKKITNLKGMFDGFVRDSK